MEDKEQWITQVMELVDKYGCAVESTVTGDPRNHPLYSDENSAYQAIRAKLLEVVSSGNAPEQPKGMRLVNAGALQMVLNALHRDAAEGKVVRGEMADELFKGVEQ